MKMRILFPLKKTCSETPHDVTDDHGSSGGSDTIVFEVTDVENDEMIVDNENIGEENITFDLTPPQLY